jgi:general secretion pathway protein G
MWLAFTVAELIIVVAIIGTLSSIAVPFYTNQLNRARIAKSISDIYVMSGQIAEFEMDREKLPDSLTEIGRSKLKDPWGSYYQFLKIEGKKKKEIQGKWRKDRWQVPVNSDYDLYSMGKDKQSKAPFTANASRDDVVRANNGRYIGLASKY